MMVRIQIKPIFKFLCIGFWLLIVVMIYQTLITSNDNSMPKEHFVIYSTIYYNTSKLYSPNSMIILLNTQKDFQTEKLNFQCLSKNETETISTKLQIRMATKDPSTNCKWEVFIANCSTVTNPTFFGLRTPAEEESMEIKYEHPVYESYPVVMCYAPMVYESRWQQLIFATEIYHHYGVDMQIQYVNSAMKQIMDILNIYESKKWIKIHEFAYFNFNDEIIGDIGLNPMKEILSRNQHLAYSDCVMKYRVTTLYYFLLTSHKQKSRNNRFTFQEAAEFIIIADIDEIIFPKQKNYFEEFSKWTALYPNAAAFTYHRSYAKIDTRMFDTWNNNSICVILLANEFKSFSMSDAIESMKIANSLFMGKTVLRTANVETPWIHWPGLINDGVTVTIDPKGGRIYHIQIVAKKIRAVTSITRLGESEELNNLIPFNPIPKYEIHSMNSTFVSSFSHLPNFKSNFIYADIIFECFKQNENWNLESCYTPFQCKIPTNISNFECQVVHRNFSKTLLNNENLVFYIPSSTYYWEKSNDKCEIFTT